MKRRKFLKAAGTAMSVPVLLNGFRLSAMPRRSLFSTLNADNDRVLVIIQLNGGNDGLNMLIPLDQYDNLANARLNIIIPEIDILNISDTLGIHPQMGGVLDLYNSAKLNIIQSVGYPEQNRSHFRSTDIWTSGSPADESWTTGWLGRYFESNHGEFPEGYPNEEYPHPFAITMGSIVSETCQGTAANFSMTLNDPFSLTPLTQGAPGDVPDTPYGEELEFLRTTIAQSNAYAESITGAAEMGANMVDYPDGNRLGEQLKNVALLISGGLQTKVYVVSIGGFDTHANQVEAGKPLVGEHSTLLQNLSEAIAAFQADLQAQSLEQRVVGLTFSEFGRQIRSNDSYGTDHGSAAPLMVFGSCVKPGVLGDNPEIPGQVEPQEGVPMQFDFRDVYGSVLMDWFEVEEMEIRSLLHEEFQYLPVLQPCTAVNAEEALNFGKDIEVNSFPNPFRDWAAIRFHTEGEWVKLSIFNNLGNEIRVLTNRRLPAGQHEVRFEAHGLPAGNYYFRLQLDGRQKTKRMLKL
ncbi:MAG: DUF1501 domain-containing protein [Lewinellaceae bacterium]|nr:DUF1501 domain-containing protein [Lewinellaceae bacterium]MCB9288388.1 DUF1501 domain-containing protein [Lewinellaceae bacterium]